MALLLGLQSCTEFFSQNVEEIQIPINSPRDSLFASNSLITFWWEQDNRVESYRLQLVRPDFSNPLHIIDTSLLESRISMSLDEGRYVWRIRAENAGSESDYQLFSMVIDTTVPLAPEVLFPASGQDINLASETPVLRWTTNDPMIDGISFPTQDSILVILEEENQELASHFVKQNEEKSWDLKTFIKDEFEGDSLLLSWKIVSFDMAGNRKEGEWVPFQIIKS